MNKEDQNAVDQVTTKEVLTLGEAAKFLGVSKSLLYKLNMNKSIPHYKPTGRMCFYNRSELIAWIQQNRISTGSEVSEKAQSYCIKKGGIR